MKLPPWSEKIAQDLAKADNLVLTDQHILILKFLRKYYIEHNMLPGQRALVKLMRTHYGQAQGNSIYLHTLFPGGPLKQGAYFAGLPKSDRCL